MPSEPPRLSPFAAKAGQVASAFGLFLCGWLAMSTDDWRRILLYSVLALGAGLAASMFTRLSR